MGWVRNGRVANVHYKIRVRFTNLNLVDPQMRMEQLCSITKNFWSMSLIDMNF